MKYWTRRYNSQRISKPQQITFEQNFGGQGGYGYMSFRDEKNVFHIIQPETIEGCRELQSQAAILALNIREPRS